MGLLLILSPFLLLPRIILGEFVDGRAVFFLLPFEKIEISFVNSVTSKPVEISFRPIFYFSAFQMVTDKETEAYYTAGLYGIQDQLKKEVRKRILVCSQMGIRFCVGGECHEVKDGCGELRLIWPP